MLLIRIRVFFDLGGNSLLAMDMFFELESVFQDKIKLLDIFENYTIHKLVDFLMEKYKDYDYTISQLPFIYRFFIKPMKSFGFIII